MWIRFSDVDTEKKSIKFKKSLLYFITALNLLCKNSSEEWKICKIIGDIYKDALTMSNPE